ncbi:thiol reductant ABC exporter subunit CydC [Mycolicibacter terrae]|uniref:Thiol reductant ABC exporter subunit CydC n=1 Tax=Mycolicibacter terrae TaxID=1788 RepID=A0AAD1I002_9MYCO|nr:thiol reductant ABC exporter subunit CydC [Mycolicibacter terrae]ORW95284.1 ABC transporter ATP-binding protein [Mycolicibacter terrae]BBX24712.1 thiol reductant ABC exporter subunit CydC [Mycolicibacter terrae]SNV95715.1 ABC transporter ATP-binding protein CydC [Mycolicibacter terrae]
MRRADLLRAAWGLLRPRLPRLLLAGALGVLSLCSALALAGVSAWLITRAWQMPPVLDLTVAVVAVRALAISRGVLHYCERLAGHDAALHAAGTARAQIYRRLAHGPVSAAARLHTGELVTRVGADVDTLADVLVRALLPVGVAAVLGVIATAAIAVISPAAAAVLAGSLLVAGVLAPWLSARAAAAQEDLARQHLSERDVSSMLALDHAPELRIAGRLPGVIAESQRRQRAWSTAMDTAARPAAMAAAMPTAAVGVSVLGALVVGIGLADAVAPTTLAILMLLPLSAFEATTALPAAAIQLTRSRIAAQRLIDLAPPDASVVAGPEAALASAATRRLSVDVRFGHREDRAMRVALELAPGDRLAITGPSGAGKTTLLMTLAGLLAPLEGRVEVDGIALQRLPENEVRAAVGFFAEDAHVFATTVRDNLLVARGDCRDDELADVLDRVGLGRWLAGLPDGLATILAGGAQGLSAGQRRRLLLARAMLSPARIVLLDEPTEHLDAGDADDLLRALLQVPGLFGADRTVVVATHHLPADSPCRRLSIADVSRSEPAR